MYDNTSRPALICKRSLSRVALFDAALPDDLVEWLWTEPYSLVLAGKSLQCKGVRQTVRLEWNSRSYVLKHYVEPSRLHATKLLVSRARARRTWNVSHRMAELGIATPRPVACVENRLGPLRRDSFLMYPYIEGCTLRTYLETDTSLSAAKSQRFRRQLSELWEQLAGIRASLGDSNVGNYVICRAGRLWVIDLDKARFYRSAEAARRHRQQTWDFLQRSWDIAEARKLRLAEAA
jgi:hypothetical protein